MKSGIGKVFFFVVILVVLWIYSFPWYVVDGLRLPTALSREYKLWLDLQWWVELDYKVDLDEVRNDPNNNRQNEQSIVEWLKSIIDKRVEVLNINDSVITSASYGTEEHIIVQVPLKWTNDEQNQENIRRTKEAIWRVIKIEFKERRDKITEEDLAQRKQIADQALLEFKNNPFDFSVVATKFKDTYENIDYWTFEWTWGELSQYFDSQILVGRTWLIEQVITWTGREQFSVEDGRVETKFSGEWYYIIQIDKVEWEKYLLSYIFVTHSPSDWMSAKDSQGRILNDTYFVKSSVQYNEAFQPMVELTFNQEWATIFGELTQRLTGQQIAIFVGGQLLTAPRVNEPILSGKAVITGSYTPEEAKQLSQDINTWVVPAPIYLTSERTIDSKLWLNSLQKLIYSGIVWFVIIIVFLLVVYRTVWIVASFWLLFYVVLLLSIVKFAGITLTLASIAWLILSIWMAIDTNILISERVKDEIKEWKKVEDAVKSWFRGAFTAVWDTHLTWFLVALVLYIFGINLIKWFGLMLWIWTIVSIFVFYNISRVLVFYFWSIKMKTKNFIGMKHHH